MDLASYLTPEFWIIAVALGVVGNALVAVPKVPGWAVPPATIVLGIAATVLAYGPTVPAVASGVLAAAVATLAYETFIKRIVSAVRAYGEDR
jgi:hypothetical protein